MIEGINDGGFINRLGGGKGGGRQYHISCADDYNKVLTNII